MTRTSRILPLLLLALALPVLLGMGAAPANGPVRKIPQPDRRFHAQVTDVTDTAFEVDDLSFEGLTLAPARMGKADLAVDFARLREVRVFRRDAVLAAVLVFADNSQQEVELDPAALLYGRTPYGLLRLAARDVKLIRFR